jgi:hypothetical protein
MFNSIKLLIAGVFLFSGTVLADTSYDKDMLSVDSKGERCDRSFTYESLTSSDFSQRHSSFLTQDQKKLLADGKLVYKEVKQRNGYYAGYIFQLSDVDNELVFAVFSKVGEHTKLGKFFVKSVQLEEDPGKHFKVFYEQQVNFPFENGKYIYRNDIDKKKLEDGTSVYTLDTTLLNSTDSSFSPKWVDAYLYAYEVKNRTFVVSCNYMVPRVGKDAIQPIKDTFNSIAKERMQQTGSNLSKWVLNVTKSPEETQNMRLRLRRMLGE